MNKYQEALDRLFMLATNGYCALEFGSKEYEDIKAILQELVDRTTPKKLDYEADGYYDGELVYDMAYCPMCHNGFEYAINDWGCDYCPNCGQALDWNCNYER